MFNNIKDSQKGISLVFTFFIMVIILAMVLGISIILISEIKMIRGMGNSVVAFYAADSGIEKTFYYDRKIIDGGHRGLCYICDSCSDCQDCTLSLPEDSSLPEDCISEACTNCTISYHTEFGEFGDEREYEVKATVVPFYGFSKTTIKSFGDYKETTRAIDLTFTSTRALSLLSLTTTDAGGNGQDGNMFNITAKKTVIIKRFETNWKSGDLTARIYWHQGGWVSSDDGNWQLVDTASMTGVDGTFVEIPIDVDLTIAVGETYGFYITNSGGSDVDINYTNGSIEDYSNDDLDLASSIGMEYPFGETFSPYIWNGIIWYE